MIRLITHTDLDGIGCYIAAKYFYDCIDVTYNNYDNVNLYVEQAISEHYQYEKIFITDLSVNMQVALLINKINLEHPGKIILLDHHKTALDLNEFDWATVKVSDGDKKCSGTQLFYEYLLDMFQETMEDDLYYITTHLREFVDHVRRYDTWEWATNDSDHIPNDLNRLLSIYGRELFIDNINNKLFPNEEDFINETDLLLLKLESNKIFKYCTEKSNQLIADNISICGKAYRVGFVIAENYISEVGNYLCSMHNHLDFVALIRNNNVSIRTNKDNIDVSEIAKYFNGGGHKASSGFSYEDQAMKCFVEEIFSSN